MKTKGAVSSYILLIGIVALITVASQLIFSIYLASNKSQIPTEQNTLIKPIDGQIEQAVLDNLNQRKKYNEANFQINTVGGASSNQATVSGMMNLTSVKGATLSGITNATP